MPKPEFPRFDRPEEFRLLVEECVHFNTATNWFTAGRKESKLFECWTTLTWVGDRADQQAFAFHDDRMYGH